MLREEIEKMTNADLRIYAREVSKSILEGLDGDCPPEINDAIVLSDVLDIMFARGMIS